MLRICGIYRQLVYSVHVCIPQSCRAEPVAPLRRLCTRRAVRTCFWFKTSLSAESKDIAARYAECARHPGREHSDAQIETTTEDIDRRGFDEQIEGPISVWLTRNNAQDRILYIVLTKGIPLRIRGSWRRKRHRRQRRFRVHPPLSKTVGTERWRRRAVFPIRISQATRPSTPLPARFPTDRTTSIWSRGSMHLPLPT